MKRLVANVLIVPCALVFAFSLVSGWLSFACAEALAAWGTASERES